MRGLLLVAAIATAGGATLSGALFAQSTVTASPPAGRLLASNCFQCHSNSGKAEGFGHITGKSPTEIYDKLREFSQGKEGPGLMASHAMGYSDAQMRQISNYLSKL